LLLVAQLVPSISTPMLIILVLWLAIIFLGFSALAPPNVTAIFLILELDQPFGGIIRISSEPMVKALSRFAK
jgi:hypothetical protein